jgi:hypothetical protein
MTNKEHNVVDSETRVKRMRIFLKPISHERAQELLDRATKPVRNALGKSEEKPCGQWEEKSAPSSSK